MRNVLSKGTNFVPTPKLNKNMVLEDLQDYVRRLKWRLYFWNKKETVTIEDSLMLKKFYIPTKAIINDAYLKQSDVEALKILLEQATTKLKNLPVNHKNNLPKREKIELNNLEKQNKLILPTDKNLGLALLEQKTFNTACLKCLNNSVQFKEITYQLDEAMFRTCMKQISNTTDDYYKLHPKILKYIKTYKATKISEFYMLPKIHKLTLEWRPIIPATGTWNFCIAKIVDHYLQKMVKNTNSYLKNTSDLINCINKLKLNGNPTSKIWLITVDVVQLYPSIPIKEACIIIENEINKHYPEISKVLNKMLQWVVQNNIFNYGNKTYLQVDGVATGSPVAPSIANLFMAAIESQTVNKWVQRKNILLYKRYIDDIFMVFEGPEHEVQNCKLDFETLHNKIKFTWEINLNQVTFLDLIIFKNEGKYLGYRVHQKELNNYLYLPWCSNHPKNTKVGIIKGELQRYRRNCSRIQDYIKVKKLFAHRLRQRGYPASIINNNINKVKFKDKKITETNRQTKMDIIVFKTNFHSPLQTVSWSKLLNPEKVVNKTLKCVTAYKKTQNMFTICKQLLGKTTHT